MILLSYLWDRSQLTVIFFLLYDAYTSPQQDFTGVYNSYQGDKVNEVRIFTQYYCFSIESKYKSGIYLGTPAIMSKKCTGVGIYLNNMIKDKGRICKNSSDLRSQKGSTHPSTILNKWYPKFLQGIERRSKPTLTIADCNNAKSFAKVIDELLS